MSIQISDLLHELSPAEIDILDVDDILYAQQQLLGTQIPATGKQSPQDVLRRLHDWAYEARRVQACDNAAYAQYEDMAYGPMN